ncbi:thiamine phosphate synthase [Vibrio lamellibrachiae]|uniref:thiamine phosphate synthase n=1 Tax=Vibrio lamellibrachiae TaxID=2910253 RepID=UPI003D0ABD29
MKILIPSSYIELTGLIQRCLLAAKKEGFGIHHVELGVSSTQQFVLIGESNPYRVNVCGASEQLTSTVAHIEPSDLTLQYGTTNTVSSAHEGLGRDSSLAVIGIIDGEQFIDAWSSLCVYLPSSNNKAIRYVDQVDDNHLHLAWVLTVLALDFPVEDSLVIARAAVSNDVSRETWPKDFRYFPIPILDDSRLDIKVGWLNQDSKISFPELEKSSLGLYPVVDDVRWIRKLLPLGISTIQLRIKNPKQSDLEKQIIESIALGEQYGAQVFINDYWQLAIKHKAFGVHLGQEDIEESNLHRLSTANIKLGLSTHGYYELLRIVQVNPSYIALGHIFPTTTKKMPSKPQGLLRLALYQSLIDTIPYTNLKDGYPTVAIGGIDHFTANRVWECGVSSLAVVRAITLAEDTEAAIRPFSELMKDLWSPAEITSNPSLNDISMESEDAFR